MIELEIIVPEELEGACHSTIDYMRQALGLTPAQCYVVLKFMLESFPEKYIPKEVKKP